jgi:hypothetical protein
MAKEEEIRKDLRQLLLRLDHLLLDVLDLLSEHCLCRSGRVDTAGLDGNENVTAVLEEVMSVEADDTGLIGLSD